MALHIVKLSLGAKSTESVRDRIKRYAATAGYEGQSFEVAHTTRMMPTRAAEIVGQGSLYWVIKGHIAGRQIIRDIRQFVGDDGIKRCQLILGSEVIDVEPRPRKAFQGWRYLTDEEAPRDLGMDTGAEEMPEEMRRELAGLGLL
jgi:hypothetical protein